MSLTPTTPASSATSVSRRPVAARRRPGRTAAARAAVAALGAALALAGCTASAPDPTPTGSATGSAAPAPTHGSAAQRAALDAYVAAERATIPALLEQLPGTYADVTIDPVYPAGIAYTYTYAQQLDPEAAAGSFETLESTLGAVCAGTLFPALAKAGVTGSPSAVYTYVNADGTRLWTKTFTAR